MSAGSSEGTGRRRHMFYFDYDKVWTLGELSSWLDDCLALGATEDSLVRYRSRGTLGQSGFAGLEVALPLPARGAGPEPEEPADASASPADGPAEEGGGSDGETST